MSSTVKTQLIVCAFDMGASDYVVKPFSPSEVAARIRAALRKRSVSEQSEPYVIGDLTIDYATRRVTVLGRPAPLTPTEFDLLAALSMEAGRVVPHDRLLRRVWSPGKPGNLRVLRTHLMHLRRKLGEDAKIPKYIFAEPRVVYQMPEGEPPSLPSSRWDGEQGQPTASARITMRRFLILSSLVGRT